MNLQQIALLTVIMESEPTGSQKRERERPNTGERDGLYNQLSDTMSDYVRLPHTGWLRFYSFVLLDHPVIITDGQPARKQSLWRRL